MKIRAETLVKKYGWVTALAGLIPLDSGRVLMDGQLYTPGSSELRRRFAFLPDIPPVPPDWSLLRLIGTTLKLYETATQGIEDRVVELLERLDLLEVVRWKFRQLSRGQIYKSVLAAFLAADPELWLVDETFASGMDPRGLGCFKDYARAATRRGRTIVYTTQIIEVAEQFADRICVLDRGRIKAYEEPAKLRSESSLETLLTQLREQPGT